MNSHDHYSELKSALALFREKEVMPLAAQIDREAKIPQTLIDKLVSHGFMGSFIEESYGGAGMDYFSYALIIEGLSQGCASTGVLVSAHSSLATWPIMAFGNEIQKKTYLPQLAKGKIGCFCLSEPDAGSDAGSLTTFAEEKEDHFELTGIKNFISNGREADLAIVFAKTEKTTNYKGISAFIVKTNTPGFHVQKCEDKLGIRGSSTAQILLDKVLVPKSDLLGQKGKGFSMAMSTLDGGRIGIAAQAVGIAHAAFKYALQYSKERVQFGRPISEFQGIQFMLADMSTKIAASKLLMEHASQRKQRKVPYSKEAAQAKLFASEACLWITAKAIQICGGNGYSKEYPVERYFRDAKITEIYEGTSEIQRLVIASLELK